MHGILNMNGIQMYDVVEDLVAGHIEKRVVGSSSLKSEGGMCAAQWFVSREAN